jgi:hypothetical protein
MLRPRDVTVAVRRDDSGSHQMTLTHKPTGRTVQGRGPDYVQLRETLEKNLETEVGADGRTLDS